MEAGGAVLEAPTLIEEMIEMVVGGYTRFRCSILHRAPSICLLLRAQDRVVPRAVELSKAIDVLDASVEVVRNLRLCSGCRRHCVPG